MRQTTTRAHRALLGTGALLGTTMITATGASAQGAPSPAPQPGPIATKASASLALTTVRRNVMAGRAIVVRGVLRPRAAGRAVSLQVRGGRGWVTVDHARTESTGAYHLRWTPRRTGSRSVRVHFGGTRDLGSARRLAGRANVYRPALASWYGPGLYGFSLACGGRLSASTRGVAHKSLPCGTKVTLRYRGRTVRVPVVDRGPYVGMREFDLTAATKHALGFGSTGTVLSTH
jgi:hypothetical protein